MKMSVDRPEALVQRRQMTLEEVKKLRDFYYEKSVALINTEEMPNILRKEKLLLDTAVLLNP